ARKVHSRPPDNRRVKAGSQEKLAGLVAPGPDPSAVLAGRDLLREVLQRLPEEERRLADLRAEGWTWPEITTAVGGTSEGRRKQLARALDRVTRQLGVAEVFSG